MNCIPNWFRGAVFALIFHLFTPTVSCSPSPTANPLIAAGLTAQPWYFPYYVYLGNCGGTLIDPLVVLTSAHCLVGDLKTYSRIPARVFVGPEKQPYEVASYIAHKDYLAKDKINGWFSATVDIALLVLAKPVPASYVTPAYRARSIPPIGTGGLYHLGRGESVEDGPSQKNVLYGTFTLQRETKYKQLLVAKGDRSTKDSSQNYTACPGDSGGPLIYKSTVIGTGAAMYIQPCGSGWTWWPNVTVYNSWIDTHLAKVGQNSPLYAPSGCTDNSIRCISWAKNGECTTNPNYMLKECRLACKTCSAPVPAPTTGGMKAPGASTPTPTRRPPPPAVPQPDYDYDYCYNWKMYTKKGFRVSKGVYVARRTVRSVGACSEFCNGNNNCYSFNYLIRTGVCTLYEDAIGYDLKLVKDSRYYGGYAKCMN